MAPVHDKCKLKQTFRNVSHFCHCQFPQMLVKDLCTNFQPAQHRFVLNAHLRQIEYILRASSVKSSRYCDTCLSKQLEARKPSSDNGLKTQHHGEQNKCRMTPPDFIYDDGIVAISLCQLQRRVAQWKATVFHLSHYVGGVITPSAPPWGSACSATSVHTESHINITFTTSICGSPEN